jgi:hypothetical protein
MVIFNFKKLISVITTTAFFVAFTAGLFFIGSKFYCNRFELSATIKLVCILTLLFVSESKAVQPLKGMFTV